MRTALPRCLARVAVVLSLPILLLAEAAMALELPLTPDGWQARPEEVRAGEVPRPLRVYDWPQPPAPPPPYALSVAAGKALSFSLADGRLAALRTMVWTRPLPPGDLSACRYFLLTYRAEGLARSSAPLNAVALTGTGADGKAAAAPLLPVAEALNDGLWHTVVGKLTPPSGAAVRVQLGTKDSRGVLQLGTLRLLEQLPALPASEAVRLPGDSTRAAGLHWQCLDLRQQYNATWTDAFDRLLQRQGKVVDGATAPDGEALGGIPFATGEATANLVRAAESQADSEPVEFLGVKTTRHYVRPPGRDDTIAVPLEHRACEVAFLMTSEVPCGGGRYAQAPGPHDFSDIGALTVELQYDRGAPDLAFPYSLADGGFIAAREAGVYVVAADPGRTLRRFVLHNRVAGNNHSLAALTLNMGDERLLPQLAAEAALLVPRRAAAPQARPPYLRREGDLLRLGNSACDLTVDCRRGFTIAGLTNRYAAAAQPCAAGSGLEVRLGDLLLTGRAFDTRDITVTGTTATITLDSRVPEAPLRLQVHLAVDSRPEVRLQLTARNTGSAPLSPTIRFPALQRVDCGKPADSVLFFPQYRAVLGNRRGAYQVSNDRSFPLQFLDVSDPVVGAGLGLLTRDTALTPLQYGIAKHEACSMYVETGEALPALEPGGSLELPETVLLPHAGDWHATLAAYQQWLASVAPAPRPREREWFQKLFAMRVHLTKKAHSWAIPIYDPTTKQYAVDEFMKADSDYLGLPPQIVHLGGWCDYDHEEGGDFLGGDYAVKDYTGGVDNLRSAVRKLQDERGIPVSLYMIPDRCRKTSEIGRTLGREGCLVRADGWVGEDGPVYYVCPAYKPWQDNYVAAAVRAQRELGVKALYVDVFGFAHGMACYCQDHGHAVPSNPKQVTRDLIRRLRQALPADVALWSEFPLDDVSARYLDGNIHYYCLNWHEYFSETYDAPEAAPQVSSVALNTYRYACPHTRQFIFLCGSNNWSSECKFPFFNGEPLYDISWFLYAGSNLELVRRALALQTQYADCFSCDRPQMEVPTERWEVHANAFPAGGRTAWTLYNARYTTVSGPVLRVPHVAGARYLDAWNGRPLQAAISGKTATLSLRLAPQGIGCIVQERGGR